MAVRWKKEKTARGRSFEELEKASKELYRSTEGQQGQQ
jgi:hypothetical protein